MVGISTTTQSANNVVLASGDLETTGLRAYSRRVVRSATLDGGAVLTDQGFADGDRTLTIRAHLEDLETIEAVEYLVRNYQLVTVATNTGFFSAAPSASSYGDGVFQFTALIKERHSSEA